jgi:regulator of sirC expression with transglutaminase-like and TPR domain
MSAIAQQRALESLLADEDSTTRQLVIEQLRAQKERHLPVVESLVSSKNSQVSSQAQAILQSWASGFTQSQPLFASPCLQGWKQLEDFCWLLARTEYPLYDPALGRRYLDSLAQRVEVYRGEMGSSCPEAKLEALQRVLSVEEEFTGDQQTYYSPSNSYLNCVLETRKGLPLTLSLVYVFVGLRLGWDMYGVSTPGHYLAYVEGLRFDPFFGGKELSVADLAKRYEASLEECRQPHFFRATPFDTARRMLSNLLNSYTETEEDEKFRRVAAYLTLLQEKGSA